MSTTSLTLYDVEQGLQSFLDFDGEALPEEERQLFELALTEQLKTAVDKRQKCGEFIRFCELQADNCKAEVERLAARKKRFDAAAERMKEYIIRVIEEIGPDGRGAYRKLEAHTITFSVRRKPAKVEVTDESQVPSQYKDATVTMPMELWRKVIGLVLADGPVRDEFLGWINFHPAEATVRKDPIKKTIEAGGEVPGAELKLGGHSLIVK